MKNLLNYLKPQDICTIFEKIYTYDRSEESRAWMKRAANLLKLSTDVSEYIQGPTKSYKLSQAMLLDNLLNFYHNHELESSLHNKLAYYIENTPGFDKLKEKQNDSFYEQHGFLQMQLTRCIGDISIDSNEYLVFDSNWIKTQEKKDMVNELFKSTFENINYDILNIFESMKHEGSLTNFTFWDFYLKNLENQNLLSFICNILGYDVSQPMTKYYEFLRKVRIIELKDSLSIELDNKNASKKNVSKI